MQYYIIVAFIARNLGLDSLVDRMLVISVLLLGC
jgi:hypothetical protein